MEEQSESKATFFQRWFGRSKLYEFEVILFGFALVLGNRNFAWNQALAFGYDVLVSNTLIIGSAFFCLCLCMGEMTSALPFSGGIFGFVRAATGPYYGFMVACLEVIFCLSYQITITYVCVMIITYAASLESSYTPNLIFIVYGFNFFLNLLGGKPFWTVVCLAGFTTFFLLLCFLFGTLVDVNKSNINFIDYCKTNKPVTFEALMQERLTVISQFQGLQYLPLLSEYTVEPRKSIPRAMMFCATEFLSFSIFVALAACSTFPGQMILQMVPTPLVFGYQHIFKIDLVKSVWLHFPGIFAPTLTFLYCTGRQLYMIAKSGFLPSFFAYTTPETGTPIVTLTLGTLIGSGMNLLIYYYPDYMQVITFVLILSCHIVFINSFVAYLFFRKKYVSLPRSFTSPLGVWGAYYGIGNNLLGFISIFKYSSRTSALLALYILLIFLASVTIFYWVYLVKHQKFSEEEKKLMFKAYLINANREKRGRLFRNNRVSNGSVTTKSATSENKSVASKNNRRDSKHDILHESPERDEMNRDPVLELNFRNQISAVRSSKGTNDCQTNPAKSLSDKIVQYVSKKFNGIPSEALDDYQQLAMLCAGGMMDPMGKQELEERFGVNDIEQAVENDS